MYDVCSAPWTATRRPSRRASPRRPTRRTSGAVPSGAGRRQPPSKSGRGATSVAERCLRSAPASCWGASHRAQACVRVKTRADWASRPCPCRGELGPCCPLVPLRAQRRSFLSSTPRPLKWALSRSRKGPSWWARRVLRSQLCSPSQLSHTCSRTFRRRLRTSRSRRTRRARARSIASSAAQIASSEGQSGSRMASVSLRRRASRLA